MKALDFLKSKKIECIIDSKSFYDVLEENANSFLKTLQGLHYLMMKYPTLSVSEAIQEFKKTYYQQTVC